MSEDQNEPDRDDYLDRIADLIDAASKHHAVMSHPERGLATWNTMAQATADAIKEAYREWLESLD